jgi:broad specificity phosphatase PhoE
VRHGQSEHHLKGWAGGWTNTCLTELGRKQAYLTGHRLKERRGASAFTFFSSDLDRAIETTQIISSILGVAPRAEGALRDLNWGIATNISLEEARKLELEKTEPLVD